MKAFRLSNPTSLEDALERLASAGGRGARDRVRVLAGGQDLLTELQEHLVEPDEVVNLKGVPGLDGVEETADGGLAVGALCTLARLAAHPALAAAAHALLREAAESVASPQIRSVGTVGGNLCQRPRCWYYRDEGSPCLKKGGSVCFAHHGENRYNAILGGGPSFIVHPSDLAPALVALGATARLRGPDGERTVELERFFTLPTEGSIVRETVLEPDELLLDVDVPPQPAGARSTYLKFRERSSYDFALSAVALSLVAEGGTIRRARLVLGGVAPIPWRCAAVEEWLVGRPLEAATWSGAAERALEGANPLEHNGFKVPLTRALVEQAFERLAR